MRTILKRLMLEDAGQAVVEYILLLIVVVGILLGSVYQFNTAFRVWAENYFGDYLACLLETGELPSLGGGGGSSGECNQVFKEFSIADGRAPLAGKGIGGDDSNKSSDDAEGSEKDKSSNSYSGGSSVIVSGGSEGSSFGRSGGAKRFRVSRNSSDEESGGDEGVNTGSSAITDLGSYENGAVIRIPLRRADQIGNGRRLSTEDKDKKTSMKVAAASEGRAKNQGPERIKVDRQLSSNTAPPEIEELTFGKFFRYLLMAAIIIAVVIFIGGQALQVSKSMD